MKGLLAILTAAALLCAAGTAAAADYKVVVNEANGVSSISRGDLAKIFLKKSGKWSDGSKADPVDLVADSPARASFSEDVLGKSVSAIKSYWQRLVFSGRGVPPAEKPSDAEVVAYVKKTPGAVGYVSAGADVAGVKVLDIR
jgi:ABC-type phosphate transport system substrate-binding protein